MADYKKYMFDNFVITDRSEEAEPIVVADPVLEAEVLDIEDETSAEEYVEEISVEEEKEVEEPKESEEKVVSYSQEELDNAVSAAEEKAYERGFNAAVSEHEKAEMVLLDSINNRLITILADVSTQNTVQEQSALQFAVSLVRKLLPGLEEKVAVKEVETFIRDNFKNFARESSLSFRFNPDIISAVAPKISQLAEKNDFEGKIALHKDDSLGLSDCKIEWKNGGVERKTAHIISQVENLLEN
ncbi:MAG: hypothetical protein E7010_05005 [Alphaproteobacteria bacterium]|nr:hypothetical protein [Alphaproteobacteria bacterium]